MVSDTAVGGGTAVSRRITPPWWMGVFERVLAGYATPLIEEAPDVEIDRTLSGSPRPRLEWFQEVMDNLGRLPWGIDAWSSEGAEPLVDGAVARLLFLLQDFLPLDGPVPVISPTWDGGVQADWELGDVYLEIEIVPDGPIRCCFVDERGVETVEEEFELAGHEDALRARIAVVVAAVSRDC